VRHHGGINALSDYRQKQLLQALKVLEPSVTRLSAEYIHFFNTSKKLNSGEEKTLASLLTYDQPYTEQRRGTLLLVAPRPGTISPWSSKATEIVHSTGLLAVTRCERAIAYYIEAGSQSDTTALGALLHDRMTEVVLKNLEDAEVLFDHEGAKSYEETDITVHGKRELIEANKKLALALSEDEIEYLLATYTRIGRNPTDIELMMFGAVNSEHCRHKIFNAAWVIDGEKQDKTLFQMIKNTYNNSPGDVLSAYSDNAAVMRGPKAALFFADPSTRVYGTRNEPVHLVAKAETHNHPTAIAPFAGAATGVGGEIRDEAATGRGAKSKMGFSGFSVSNLNLPELPQPWEKPYGKPGRIVSPLDIMIEGPLGGSAFANEFGRPNLAGYFRTLEQEVSGEVRGYHKPLMLAGGLGNIRDRYVHKKPIPAGALIIVLGGPSMLIGLGGGAASSMGSGQSDENLDFASVQRGNGEMQRRAQEVINSCWADDDNPIISIHDVGAGGISNALPELVHDAGLGAMFELRDIPTAEPGLSPLEIWCNEAQERFVLAIDKRDLPRFSALCELERCPFAVVGTTTKKEQLVLNDRLFSNQPINIPMDLLFGKPPKMTRQFTRAKTRLASFDTAAIQIEEAARRVLQLPSVGSKKFLITIGDRTVGGLVARDQMVGPWQVPVSDVAVTASAFSGHTGEAMAIGERTPVALINAAASARLAVGEAITNIVAAKIGKLSDIKLSANWMAAAGHKNEDQYLHEAVAALGQEFCPALGIAIPVGKDSLSMHSSWQDKDGHKSVSSPMSVIISAFAPVTDTGKTLTPYLSPTPSSLVLLDLGQGKNRLGGSALAQTYGLLGNEAPDIDPAILMKFFHCVQSLNQKGLLLAYHDRSDGGLFATLCEMAFATRSGLDIDLSELPGTLLEKLFSEELGAVIQVSTAKLLSVLSVLNSELGHDVVHVLGKPSQSSHKISLHNGGKLAYQATRSELESWWAETSYQIQKQRDNPDCAKQEYQLINELDNPGLSPKVSFASGATVKYKGKPKVAVFREQGVNGQVEMAAAFDHAGFTAIDVHLNDLLSGRISLADFSVLAACGGFSYGDVLGAGGGWAKSILGDKKLRAEFQQFFNRADTLSLGVCNGCQMLSGLKELIPGADHWPKFLKNTSDRFEARLVSVRINKSPSVFFRGMQDSVLPVPVAHGEGRAVFANPTSAANSLNQGLVPLQYVDNYGKVTEQYPLNPNGSSGGITALTSQDGRATILMPHPERVFLTKQLSWHPAEWPEESPWLKIFQNAREWLEKH